MDQALGRQPHPLVDPAKAEKRRQYRYAYGQALFLHPNHRIASQIAHESLVGLPDTCSAQERRFEYTLKGDFRTRICMESDHLLQRHVFAASEKFEKQREKSGRITQEDLTVYYVKETLRMAMKCASFPVMVAIGRVLHAYRTRQVMNMYSTIAPRRSGKKNDDQCRQWKKDVMDHLGKRFGRYLSMAFGLQREKRFSKTKDRKLLAMAKASLEQFVPCRTPHSVPDNCGETGPEIFNYAGPPDGEHVIELLRLHAAICPACLLRLATAWKLDTPDARADIPNFKIPPGDIGEDDYGNRGTPPELDDATVDAALEEIAAESERRRTVSPFKLRVLVDGVEVSELDLEAGPLALKVNVTQEVVTVVSGHDDVLVTHLLTFGDEGFFVTTTTEYTVGGFVLGFVEQQGGPSRERVLEIKPRPAGMIPHMLLASCGAATYDLDVAPGVGRPRTFAARVIAQLASLTNEVGRCCYMLGAGVGCGKSVLAVRGLATHIGLTLSRQRRKTSTSEDGDQEKQLVPVSEMRETIDAINALTRREAELYLDFYETARKREVDDLQVVPHVHRRHEEVSRLSFWASAILSGCAGVLLSVREPLGALALAPLISLAVLVWRHFGWSRRLTSQYTATKEILEALQRDLWAVNDPLANWHTKYRQTDKLAFLFGHTLQPDVRSLASVLGNRGYKISILDPALYSQHSIIRKRLDNISNVERSTCLFYFSGHGHFEVLEETLRDVASSQWCHAAPLYSHCRDVLRNPNSDGPLLFVGEASLRMASWAKLSLGVPYFDSRSGRPDYHYLIVLNACALAITEAFLGAAGREGLLTISDVEEYVKRRVNDPNLVGASGRVDVSIRHSDAKSKDMLLSAMPARASPTLGSEF